MELVTQNPFPKIKNQSIQAAIFQSVDYDLTHFVYKIEQDLNNIVSLIYWNTKPEIITIIYNHHK